MRMPNSRIIWAWRWRLMWASSPLIFLFLSLSFWGSETFWEGTEYFAEAIVFAGCLGEFLTEYEHVLIGESNHAKRHRLSRSCAIILMAGLAVELTALVRTNELFSKTIANLNVEAGNARLDAGHAVERAGAANKAAGNARREAGAANKEAGDAKERAGRLEKDAARLRKQAEDERMARVELEDKVAWRAFNDQQKTDIKSNLDKFGGQLAVCSFFSGDTEAFSFSSAIAAALRVARWRVVPPNPNVFSMKETSLPTTASSIETIDFGVEVVSTPDAPGVAAAHAITEELNGLGFDASFNPRLQRPQASTVWVTVEHRPLGPQGEAKLRAQKANNRP